MVYDVFCIFCMMLLIFVIVKMYVIWLLIVIIVFVIGFMVSSDFNGINGFLVVKLIKIKMIINFVVVSKNGYIWIEVNFLYFSLYSGYISKIIIRLRIKIFFLFIGCFFCWFGLWVGNILYLINR